MKANYLPSLNRPLNEDLLAIAILFNDGILDSKALSSMVGMCNLVLDRLQENNDVTRPCSVEAAKSSTPKEESNSKIRFDAPGFDFSAMNFWGEAEDYE